MNAPHVAPMQPELEAIDKRLRAFRGSSSRRFKAHIERLLPAIESAMADGSTRHEVHELLVSEGMTITFEGFKSALYRLRKSRRLVAGTAVKRPAETAKPISTAIEERRSPPAATARVASPPPSSHAPSLATPTPSMSGPSIAEIARTNHNMNDLRQKGREYAAKLKQDEAAAAKQSK